MSYTSLPMTGMTALDWGILLVYLLLALAAGVWLRKRASADLDSYFVAGRKMAGWLVGTSMVATTFAADTPLAVTGLVAQHGVAGNWFWWSLALGHIGAAFFFARLWRRAHVVTDAELIELRYSGRPAATLRLVRALYFAVPINCITMAWVMRAMGKIVAVLFPWDQWLPPELYGYMVDVWPSWMAISSPSEAISILIGVAIAVIYAALGGLHSVIVTDVVQFSLAMVGSIALAVAAVSSVGGLGAIPARLHEIYGPKAQEILATLPSSDASWLPLEAFLVYLCVQWWAYKYSDGGGILVQRMSAARDEAEAQRGTAWFVVAHYALRPWPWILVGLVALILYPLGATPSGALSAMVAADREMAYPVLMAQLLPPGLLGVMVTGMAAAFMSTIDTHVNWGSSYLVRDVYQRFLRPNATQAQLVRAGRVGVLVIIVLALGMTTQVDSIAGAWKFITAMSSGLGLVSILRWFWWRVNAWSEITGLVSAAALSFFIYGSYGGGPDASSVIPYHEVLVVVVAFSTAAILLVTLLTPPTAPATLRAFCARVRPFGAWGAYRTERDAPLALPRVLAACLVGAGGLFSLLFGLGELLLGSTSVGLALVVAGGGAWWAAVRLARPALTEHSP